MFKKTAGRRRIRPNKETFEKEYYETIIYAEEMAKKYNVKTQTIYNWANYYRKKEKNERNNN